MSTVYVVTAGSYSDYHIEAMFSTREAADAYAAWYNGPSAEDGDYDNATVEEYELDATSAKATGAFVAWGNEGSFGDYPDGVTGPRWDREADPNEGVKVSRVAPRMRALARGANYTIRASGPTAEHALRQLRETARALVAGTLIVPPDPTL